ncbi:MAG TPA: hypothetical protein VND21_11815 [Planctomycetota bacterium]|nr:hypothetical protein [Planctomycetota bacterium]
MSAKRPDDPSAPSPKTRRRRRRVIGLLGVGLDNQDGHTRITKGQEFFLVGGSAETHERMQDFTVQLTERLAKKGKRISDATAKELGDLASDIGS